MITTPYKKAAAVTPSDSTVLAATRGLYVGSAGALKVTTKSGDDVTFGAVTAGALLPLSVTKVFSTGTAASNIVALY